MEIHPIADLIPPMTDEEYKQLRVNIEEHGLQEPIVLYEGKILDGRHRYRACEQLGVKPKTREYDATEPVAFVLSANVHRRHLDKVQLAEIGRRALPALQEEARRRQGEHARSAERDERGHLKPSPLLKQRTRAGNRETDAAAVAAKAVGVDRSTIQSIDLVAREDPELHKRVLAKEVGMRPAADLVRSRKRAEEKANGFTPDTDRKANIAKRNYERLSILLGQVQAIADGIEAINLDAAMSLLIPSDAEEWIEDIRRTRSALLALSNRMRKESEHGTEQVA